MENLDEVFAIMCELLGLDCLYLPRKIRGSFINYVDEVIYETIRVWRTSARKKSITSNIDLRICDIDFQNQGIFCFCGAFGVFFCRQRLGRLNRFHSPARTPAFPTGALQPEELGNDPILPK